MPAAAWAFMSGHGGQRQPLAARHWRTARPVRPAQGRPDTGLAGPGEEGGDRGQRPGAHGCRTGIQRTLAGTSSWPTGMQGRRPDRDGRPGRVRAALRAAALRAMRPPPEPPRRVAHTPRSLHGPPKRRRRCLGFRVGPSHRASVLAHWRFPLNEKKADWEIAIPLNRHGLGKGQDRSGHRGEVCRVRAPMESFVPRVQ
jgi:hypothetical protein